MKFKLFFILILLPCLVFCGCKKDQLEATVPQPTVTEPPTEPPAPKAGLLLRNMTADEQDGLALQGALESIGYEVLVRDGENDQSKQNQQATDLVAAGCEVLVLQPVMVSGLDVLLKDITGIPVVILDAQPTLGEGFPNVTVLTAPKTSAGTAQAALLSLLPNGGDINEDGLVSMLIIEGPDKHLESASRASEFYAGIDPAIHIVLEAVSAEWNTDAGRAACAQLLAKYGPDAEVIVTFGEEVGLGSIAAVENGGWVPGQDFHLLTIGNSSVIRNELSLGRISGLSAADPQLRLSLLLELVQATTPTQEKIHYIDYIPIVP